MAWSATYISRDLLRWGPVSRLSDRAQLVFLRLYIDGGDCYGRYDADEFSLRATLGMVDGRDVTPALDELVDAGVCRRYTVDGKPYVDIPEYDRFIGGEALRKRKKGCSVPSWDSRDDVPRLPPPDDDFRERSAASDDARQFPETSENFALEKRREEENREEKRRTVALPHDSNLSRARAPTRTCEADGPDPGLPPPSTSEPIAAPLGWDPDRILGVYDEQSYWPVAEDGAQDSCWNAAADYVEAFYANTNGARAAPIDALVAAAQKYPHVFPAAVRSALRAAQDPTKGRSVFARKPMRWILPACERLQAKLVAEGAL